MNLPLRTPEDAPRPRPLGILIGFLALAALGLADLVMSCKTASGDSGAEPQPSGRHVSEQVSVDASASDADADAAGGGDQLPVAERIVVRLTPRTEVAPFVPARSGGSGRVIARVDLIRRVNELLARVAAGVDIAVCARSVTTGEELLATAADRPLIAASNTKLMTSAAVLGLLGPDATLDTVLYASELPVDGTLAADLIVKGGGDPDAEGREQPLLEELIAAVQAAGIQRIRGDIVVDDLCFDRRFAAPGWPISELGSDIYAPVAGFSLAENCVRIQVEPGAGEGELARARPIPDVPLFAPDIAIKTGPARSKNVIDVPGPVAPGKLLVRGSTPLGSRPAAVAVPVLDPPATNAQVLRQALVAHGIQVSGSARIADRPIGVDGQQLRRLAVVSTPLQAALWRMNKDSCNVVAEHLFKLAGREVEGLGTFESGGRAVLAVLRTLGVDPTGATCADGSGLSRDDRFTARQFVGVLRGLYLTNARDALLASMAILGEDGTLSSRLSGTAYAGRVRAKSGYIRQVSTLSGFAQTDSGEVIAFSVLTNGFRGNSTPMKELQHDVVKLLVDLAPPREAP